MKTQPVSSLHHKSDQEKSEHFPMLPSMRCPVCHGELNDCGDKLVCQNLECQAEFPVSDGIPVLINEARSLFSISDFVKHDDTFFKAPDNKLFAIGMKILERLPSINGSIGTRERYAKMADILLKESPNPVVLIVGGSIIGYGMKEFLENPAIRFVETDISFGPRTQMICDSHDIPFRDDTFDGVVAQAVLEHVIDPYRCVGEIHRVLKSTGIVYAETPFMQQVHGGRYDFLRFTYLGYRRLFRHFAEIESGVVCGPGMALAWSWTYFALSMATSRVGRAIAYSVTSVSSFWLKYFDKYLVKKPGAFDAASGYYLMARKSDETLSDRDLIKLYRGGHR